MKIYKVLLKRLKELGIHPFVCDSEPWWINYDNKISVYGLLNRIKKENKIMYDGQIEWSAADHARRIYYLSKHSKDLYVPIKMDSYYDREMKMSLPSIEDGWHRLYAHYYLNKKFINVQYRSFSSKKLLNYLIGKVDDY